MCVCVCVYVRQPSLIYIMKRGFVRLVKKMMPPEGKKSARGDVSHKAASRQVLTREQRLAKKEKEIIASLQGQYLEMV